MAMVGGRPVKDVPPWLGGEQHRVVLLDENAQLVRLCVAHVDDFLIGLDETSSYAKEKLTTLQRLYQWGSWGGKDVQMCGVRVRQIFAGGCWGNILLHQYEHIRKLPDVDIPKKSRDDDLLTGRQTTELRSLIGAVQWGATAASCSAR